MLNEIIAPADTAAVAEVVREAAKEGQAVYPRGGGTHWNYGVMPSRCCVSPRPLGEGQGVRVTHLLLPRQCLERQQQ